MSKETGFETIKLITNMTLVIMDIQVINRHSVCQGCFVSDRIKKQIIFALNNCIYKNACRCRSVVNIRQPENIYKNYMYYNVLLQRKLPKIIRNITLNI